MNDVVYFVKKSQLQYLKMKNIYFYIVPCMNNIENNYMVAWTNYDQILRI